MDETETAEAFAERVMYETNDADAQDEDYWVAHGAIVGLTKQRDARIRAEARRAAIEECLHICIKVINAGNCTLEVERCLDAFRSLLSAETTGRKMRSDGQY